MKKVLFIMMIAVLLVAFAAPAFADKDGVANENADWGQLHKLVAATGSVSEVVHIGQAIAEVLDTNLGQLIKIVK